MTLGPALIVSIQTCAWRGGDCAGAGHGGLTHIIIVFLVVELAAAGNNWCCPGGGWRCAILLFVVYLLCQSESCVNPKRAQCSEDDVPHFPGAMVAVECVE
jgi:hypothetical protein